VSPSADFDDRPHTGELVVAASGRRRVAVFRRLYAAGFPNPRRMRLADDRDLNGPPDRRRQQHRLLRLPRRPRAEDLVAQRTGPAVDINPFHNPLVKRDLVLAGAGQRNADRAKVAGHDVRGGRRGGGRFAAIGWTWGGDLAQQQGLHALQPERPDSPSPCVAITRRRSKAGDGDARRSDAARPGGEQHEDRGGEGRPTSQPSEVASEKSPETRDGSRRRKRCGVEVICVAGAQREGPERIG
jgi:hypothetical protein